MSSITKRFRVAGGCIELFAMEGRPAVELLASNPLAGFCLALNDQFHKPAQHWPLAAARIQMHKPQREILGWLGFQPASEAIAKLGRKCIPEALNTKRCLNLRQSLRDPEVRGFLAHLPQINAGVIGLVATEPTRRSLTPQLLRSVADDPEELAYEPTAELLRDTIEMHHLLDLQGTPPRFLSRVRLRDKHDELMAEITRRGTNRTRRRRFPPAPIAGIRDSGVEISPVVSAAGLYALGEEQHNCVASYANQAHKGLVFIYRVAVNNEICTLSLVKDLNGILQVDQFKASCNRKPSAMAEYAMNRWLEAGRLRQRGFPLARPYHRESRALPIGSLAGDVSGSVRISPIGDQGTLLRLLGNWVAVDFYTQRTKQERFYEAVTPQGPLLVAIEQQRGRYRLTELRSPNGGRASGEVLTEIAAWMGRAQGRYR